MATYKPILFSGPMVRAIMTCAKCGRISSDPVCECGSTEFKKTQTRREVSKGKSVCDSAPWDDLNFDRPVSKDHAGANEYLKVYDYGNPECRHRVYGKYAVGDVLWVRETWAEIFDDHAEGHIKYRATCPEGIQGRWKPSIHMPKSACRLFLCVTDVRVARLRTISIRDAKAEGMKQVCEELVERFQPNWEPQCWLSDDAGPSFCRACAEKRAATSEDIYVDGGYSLASIEVDHPEYCEDCGKMLEFNLITPEYFFMNEDGSYDDGRMYDEEIAMLYNFNFFDGCPGLAKEAFRYLWDSLNAKRGYGWDNNPWVWAYTFQRIAKPENWLEAA